MIKMFIFESTESTDAHIVGAVITGNWILVYIGHVFNADPVAPRPGSDEFTIPGKGPARVVQCL